MRQAVGAAQVDKRAEVGELIDTPAAESSAAEPSVVEASAVEASVVEPVA